MCVELTLRTGRTFLSLRPGLDGALAVLAMIGAFAQADGSWGD